MSSRIDWGMQDAMEHFHELEAYGPTGCVYGPRYKPELDAMTNVAMHEFIAAQRQAREDAQDIQYFMDTFTDFIQELRKWETL